MEMYIGLRLKTCIHRCSTVYHTKSGNSYSLQVLLATFRYSIHSYLIFKVAGIFICEHNIVSVIISVFEKFIITARIVINEETSAPVCDKYLVSTFSNKSGLNQREQIYNVIKWMILQKIFYSHFIFRNTFIIFVIVR